jgi:hypothetical protein
LKLLDFTEFVNEAALKQHFEDRTRQRIMNSLIVTLSDKTLTLLRENGISTIEVQPKIADLIRQEFESKVRVIQRNDFANRHVADIMLIPIIKIGKFEAPVKMSVESVDIDPKTQREIIKIYHGEMIVGYINHNEAVTLKVFPTSVSHEELAKNSNDHHIRKFGRTVDTQVIEHESSKLLISVKEDGTVEKLEKASANFKKIAKVESEYTLSPGRIISVWIPFMRDFVPVEIVEVMNRTSARADGFVKVLVQLPDGRKVPKTLKPGDQVKTPGKDGDGLVDKKVADSLFVDYDKRGGEFAIKFT